MAIIFTLSICTFSLFILYPWSLNNHHQQLKPSMDTARQPLIFGNQFNIKAYNDANPKQIFQIPDCCYKVTSVKSIKLDIAFLIAEQTDYKGDYRQIADHINLFTIIGDTEMSDSQNLEHYGITDKTTAAPLHFSLDKDWNTITVNVWFWKQRKQILTLNNRQQLKVKLDSHHNGKDLKESIKNALSNQRSVQITSLDMIDDIKVFFDETELNEENVLELMSDRNAKADSVIFYAYPKKYISVSFQFDDEADALQKTVLVDPKTTTIKELRNIAVSSVLEPNVDAQDLFHFTMQSKTININNFDETQDQTLQQLDIGDMTVVIFQKRITL